MRPIRRFALVALAVLCAALGSLAWWLLRDRTASPSGPIAGVSGATVSPESTQTPPPPVPDGPWAAGADVLLITVDTLRADSVGFAEPPRDGSPDRRAATPLLDRLAAAGRVFTDAHAHNVVTLPSHANLLTGLYPFQHGVRDNAGFRLPDTVPTLATLLAGAGYATAAFVGAYPLDSRFGLARGFEVYDDRYPRGSNPADPRIAERRGDEVVAAARRWWDGARGRRRFLWVHLYDPHAPYAPPEPFAGRFRDRPYLGEVAATDSFLAPLLAPLLDGAEPPALVAMTSDHGEALGEHGELTHGLFAYEPTLKVPLVLWGPAIAPGRDSRPARHVDLLPTLLDALGVVAPEGLPGRSLLRPSPPGEPGESDSYFEALTANLDRGWAPLRGVLRERRKLIELPVPELYDLARDPAESRNRFGEERRAARELAAALPAGSAWPPGRGTVSGEEAARLRSLGYAVGSAEPRTRYGPADDPKNLVQVDAALQQAVLAYSAGRYEEAAARAREVIALRPGMADGPEQLALALRQLERHDEAIAALQEAVARGVRDESLRRALALALAEVGRAGEAVTVLAPYLNAAGGSGGFAGAGAAADPEPATLIALGVALSDAGRPGEAVAVLERAGRLDPEDPKVHENLGIAELRRGDAPGARGHLERALALNQALPISWNTLGVARYQLGDRAGALEAWQRAAALDPRQFDALFNLGLVAAEAGRPDLARQALGRFVATAPPGRFGPDLQKARQILARLGG
jgi:arylsulfatase A-like enzyme/Flp pilus assembly protein TadD